MKTKTWDDFKEFLEEYKVLSVAIAFMMGIAINEVVESFVKNIFMPLLDPLIPNGTWQTAVLSIGPINIGWGAFVASLLHLLILGVVIFILVKKLLNKPKKRK